MPPTCPICRRAAAPRPENTAFPFCSERCRLVDLGKWLGEEYRVPDREASSSSPPPAGAGSSDAGSSREGER